MALKHTVPRKINAPPPMILGLTGGQSFFWVGSMILFGLIASSFNGWGVLWAWFSVFFILVFELVFLRFINSRRRALVGHSIARLKSLITEPKRFTGRGFSPEKEDVSTRSFFNKNTKKKKRRK